MASSLIGLGSNLGERTTVVDAAVELLDADADIRVIARSGAYETEPVGGPADQGRFINSAVLLDTDLSPQDLIAKLHEVEQRLGRQRRVRWDARTIDLDLLLYDEVVLVTPELTIPHPRMSFRRFVLEPACEIAGEMIHPVCGWRLMELLEHIRSSLNYVALAGPLGAGKSRLAEAVSDRLKHRHNIESQLILEDFDSQRVADLYGDPTSHAWDVELEFLVRRRDLLDAARWPESGTWLISDFWFDQSLAYASVWLDRQQAEAYQGRWEQASKSVIKPKLLVALNPSLDQLVASITQRNRSYEQSLSTETLERIRIATSDLAHAAGHGPVLQLGYSSSSKREQAIDDVVAAILSMR